jgi:hypothetical protein
MIALVALLPARTFAGDPEPARITRAEAAPRPASTRSHAALMSDLARVEDEGLTRHRAGGHWERHEIVIVVLLMIFLFPIGLIVLIVLACNKR